ncbi:MAG: MBL fold metallo-hydrolase [Nitrososphaeria archaeon]
MKIVPLGEESFGIRSMCVKVDVEGTIFILDPGASLAPRRFGLPPHPLEIDAIKKFRERLYDDFKEVEYLFISHYHRDHFTPVYKSVYMGTEGENIYKKKKVLVKNYNNANYSQKVRGYMLEKDAKSTSSDWIFADGKSFKIGDISIKVSDPIPHGKEGSKTGFIIGISIKHKGFSLTYIPDVQGPLTKKAVKFAKETKPDMLIIGGFPYYLLGYAFNEEDLELSKKLLAEIVEKVKPETMVIGHHLLRSKDWVNAVPENISFKTYASLLGMEERLLEARRKELYEKEKPPPEHFELFKKYAKDEED